MLVLVIINSNSNGSNSSNNHAINSNRGPPGSPTIAIA